MASNEKKSKTALAEAEYARLIEKYTEGGADAIRLAVDDALIRKAAELWATLEAMKNLPTIIYDPRNPSVQRETAAGKARVKYMAQYASVMQKLNKGLLGAINGDDDNDLDDYE